MKTDDHHCLECGTKLIGKNAIDVGYCIPCYAMLMADPDDDDDDFQPCCDCDGHDACADFGCAFKLGLGHLVRPPLIIAMLILSISAFAQVPTYQIRVDVLDSMIFEVKRGRSCDSLQKAQLVVIRKQEIEIAKAYDIAEMHIRQITKLQAKNMSYESTMRAIGTKHEAEKGILKAKIRKLRRMIVAESGLVILVLLVAL